MMNKFAARTKFWDVVVIAARSEDNSGVRYAHNVIIRS